MTAPTPAGAISIAAAAPAIGGILAFQPARRRHGRKEPLLWLDRRGSDVPRHAGDGGSDGRARRHHAAARAGIRLELRRHLVGARVAHRPLRPDGAVFGRLHQPLRRPAGGHGGGGDDLPRDSRFPHDDRALAACGVVGRHCRRRHRARRPGARRDRRDALVRRAARACRRHADGEQRDGSAHLPAPAREADPGLRLAQRAWPCGRDAACGGRRRPPDAARPAGRRPSRPMAQRRSSRRRRRSSASAP